jgi:transcriptional regulator with XRE-family HTH domain
MKLSERIRQLRKTHQLKLREIADLTGLSITYISDIEHDKTAPAIKSLTAIAGAFNMTLIELLQGVEFSGEADLTALPPSLQEFIQHPDVADEIDADWLALLRCIRVRGRVPATVRDWMGIYLVLRDKLG